MKNLLIAIIVFHVVTAHARAETEADPKEGPGKICKMVSDGDKDLPPRITDQAGAFDSQKDNGWIVICSGTKPENSDSMSITARCPVFTDYITGGYRITTKIEGLGSPSVIESFPYYCEEDNS